MSTVPAEFSYPIWSTLDEGNSAIYEASAGLQALAVLAVCGKLGNNVADELGIDFEYKFALGFVTRTVEAQINLAKQHIADAMRRVHPIEKAAHDKGAA
jgi:hypothetical protein